MNRSNVEVVAHLAERIKVLTGMQMSDSAAGCVDELARIAVARRNITPDVVLSVPIGKAQCVLSITDDLSAAEVDRLGRFLDLTLESLRESVSPAKPETE